MSEAFRLIGPQTPGGILIVSDHASNHVPGDIDLGIARALLMQHVAIDIGVGAIGDLLVERTGCTAFQGGVSRLVCDFNREPDSPGVVPIASDGHAIPGNALDHAGHLARLDRFFHPYHAALEAVCAAMRPALILSLHSFTPELASNPDEARPWHVGVLHNRDRRASALALDWLGRDPALVVGDQQPYSGVLLNATMNRHAEANGIPYVGIEIRQDLIGDRAGQAAWADRLAAMLEACLDGLKAR